MGCCRRRRSLPPLSLSLPIVLVLPLLFAFPSFSSASASSPSTCNPQQSQSPQEDCSVGAGDPPALANPPTTTCAQLRLQLAAQGPAPSQIWEDSEHSQRCRITFDKREGAAVTYTISKDLLQQLISVLTQHVPHDSTADPNPTQSSRPGADADSGSSSSSRIKAFLGLASEDMKVLVAALSLSFPRMAMGWQAYELLTQEAAIMEPLTASFNQRPETKAQAQAQHSTGDQHCDTVLCTWQRMVQEGKTAGDLEQLLHMLLTLPSDNSPSASSPASSAAPATVPAAETSPREAAQQQQLPGSDSTEAVAPRGWQASTSPSEHGGIRSSTGPRSGSGPGFAASRRPPPPSADLFEQGLLLSHVAQLFEELLLWDLLYWLMWYCCPSMMVAYNAITSLAPEQPLLVLYICTVAALQALIEWRLAVAILGASYRRDEAALIRQSLACAGAFCYTMPASLLSALLLTLGAGLVGHDAVKWLLLLLLVQPVVVLALRGRMWVRLEARYRSAQVRTLRQQQQQQAPGAGAGAPQPLAPRAAAHHRPHAAASGGWAHRTAAAHQLPPRPAGQPTTGQPPTSNRPYSSTRIPDPSSNPPHRSTSLASLPEVHWPPPLDYPSWLEDEPDLPDAFRCPITLTLMREPTSASSGLTYERKAIFQWLQLHRVDPVCQVPLKRHRLTPNLNLRHMLENWAGGKLAEQRRQEGKVLAALKEEKAGKGAAELDDEAAAAAAAAAAAVAAVTAASAPAGAVAEEGQ